MATKIWKWPSKFTLARYIWPRNTEYLFLALNVGSLLSFPLYPSVWNKSMISLHLPQPGYKKKSLKQVQYHLKENLCLLEDMCKSVVILVSFFLPYSALYRLGTFWKRMPAQAAFARMSILTRDEVEFITLHVIVYAANFSCILGRSIPQGTLHTTWRWTCSGLKAFCRCVELTHAGAVPWHSFGSASESFIVELCQWKFHCRAHDPCSPNPLILY